MYLICIRFSNEKKNDKLPYQFSEKKNLNSKN